jgi:hypothetical protein
MLRPAAVLLLLVLAAVPVAILPAAPVTWLVALALTAGGAGVVMLSVALVTAGASLALIAYALALVLQRPAIDPLMAIAVGATLALLLPLAHFAARGHGAAVDRDVVAAQARRWLATVGLGAAVAAALTLGGAALGAALPGVTLPVLVATAALGALLAVAGAIALLTRERRSA